MDTNQLLQACHNFEKLAQQLPKKTVIDPKKKNIDFWSNLLLHALQSYAQLLPSPVVAKQIFNNIATYHQSPAMTSDTLYKQLNQIDAAIAEASTKLQQAGIDPIVALTKLGVSNLNTNSLNTLKNNLQVLQDGADFSKYQHYYLPAHGEAKDIIELDQDTGPGY